MKGGEIVLAELPQADGTTKLRPALVRCSVPPLGDLLLCGVSTNLEIAEAGFDEVVLSADDDFFETGLDEDSVIRLGFVSAVPVKRIKGLVGRVSMERLARARETLGQHILNAN